MKRYISLSPKVLSFVALTILATGILHAQQSRNSKPHEDDRPELRDSYFFRLRSYPFDKIPQGAWLSAITQSETNLQPFRAAIKSGSTTQGANRWRCIGPFTVGGRVNAIAIHPGDARTVYIGAANGGVWKTTNGGTTWSALMDNTSAIAMGAITIDPSQPNTVYAGTGENHGNVDAYTGSGIMKSTDAGATWKVLGLTNVGAFSRIVVHPTNSQIILVATGKNNGGVYRTEDRGATWTRTLDKSSCELSLDPLNPNNVLVGTFANGLYRSADGGKTFTPSNTGMPATAGWTLGRISVRYAPSNPSIAYLLVQETQSGSSPESRIYKSTNGGANWSMILNNNPDVLSELGWYNNCLAVKPNDPNTVIAGGTFVVIQTTDGGQTWSQNPTMHVDHHAVEFAPGDTNTVYDGNDGGVYTSTNAGKSWTNVSSGLAITQFYAMGIDQAAAAITYGGSQDNGTMKHDGTILADGDGGYTVVDYSNPNIVYGEKPQGELWKVDGANKFLIMDGFDAGDAPEFMSPLIIDPKAPKTLYNGRKNIYKTTNSGTLWQAVSPYIGGNVSALAISPVSSNILFAGSDKGGLLRSTDAGNSWENIVPGSGLPNRAVMDIVASPTKAGTIYLAYSGFGSGHIFKTVDTGRTWKDISHGFPDIAATAIAIHPGDERVIYLGSDIGMFISTDDGITWSTYNNGLPRTVIADLEIHKSSNVLRVATHGRSMWEIDLESTVLPAVNAPSGGETWTARLQYSVMWQGFTGAVKLEYSFDDGATWKTMKDSVTGNVQSWRVPDTNTTNARIRITNISRPEETTVSNRFNISKSTVGQALSRSTVPVTPYGLCYDGRYLWTPDYYGTTILKIDPATLTTVGTVSTSQLDSSYGITAITYHPGKKHFFLHRLHDSPPGGVLYEMDTNGKQINRWESPCIFPVGLTWMYNDSIPYLVASDRDGGQTLYLINPDSAAKPVDSLLRVRQVPKGPRGATQGGDGKSIYQVITDYTDGELKGAWIEKMTVDKNQTLSCRIPLLVPNKNDKYIDARGIAFDPRDSNVWVTDFNGDIYKIVTCDGLPDSALSTVVRRNDPRPVSGFTLSQNTPNPFGTSTDIVFSLDHAAEISLTLHDMQGREVAIIGSGRFGSGQHTMTFQPRGIASGVYRYVLNVNGTGVASRTMTVVR